jgi:surfactin synthase thioesterase subunit
MAKRLAEPLRRRCAVSDSRSAPPRERWLLREPSGEAEALLFCFPYMGTGASLFHDWPRSIDGVEVCPVQLPGRENRLREPPYESYEGLADELTTALARYLDRPFVLFGHCASAYVAFETAVALERRGLPGPRRVVVSSMMPPHESSTAPILALGEGELSGELARVIEARGGYASPEFVELSLAVMRADVGALRRYRRAMPIRMASPITAIAWRSDEQVASDQVSRWAAYGEVDIVLLDGSHWSFVDCPAGLRTELARAAGVASPPAAAAERGVLEFYAARRLA